VHAETAESGRAANDKRLSGQLSALTNSCGVKTEKYFKRVKLQRLPSIRPLPSGSAILARLDMYTVRALHAQYLVNLEIVFPI